MERDFWSGETLFRLFLFEVGLGLGGTDIKMLHLCMETKLWKCGVGEK